MYFFQLVFHTFHWQYANSPKLCQHCFIYKQEIQTDDFLKCLLSHFMSYWSFLWNNFDLPVLLPPGARILLICLLFLTPDTSSPTYKTISIYLPSWKCNLSLLYHTNDPQIASQISIGFQKNITWFYFSFSPILSICNNMSPL